MRASVLAICRLLPLALPGMAVAAATAGAPVESRVALVIGNAAYPSMALRNPVNDATAMAERLRALGFAVTLKTDVKQRDMTRAVSHFGQSIKPGGVALFYYAGHGMQVRGRNFLIPVDAEIDSEASVRSEAVDLDLILEQLGPARLSMVILDACRNNPFENRFRSGGGGGLAQVDAPKGTLLAYATAPGKVASDGDGPNGLYTSELLKAIDLPATKVEEVFKVVRVNVIKATGSQQIPWESSSLTGDFYFRPGAPSAVANKVAPDAPSTDAPSKEAQLQARLDAERRQREEDARTIKAEMEKLRLEVRRLTESSAAPETVPAAPAKPEALRSNGAGGSAAAKPEGGGPAKPKSEGAPERYRLKSPPAANSPAAPSTPPPKIAAAATATANELVPEQARKEWSRRIAILERQRGTLTLSKALAVLLGPFTDEQLTVLVDKERFLRNMPYPSAFALGITPQGTPAVARVWGERTPDIAQDIAIQHCSRSSVVRCSAVMVNGEFREAAFLEWAGHVHGKSFLRMRNSYLAKRFDSR